MAEERSISEGDLRLALRAELAELELRLLDKLVTKAEHEALVARYEVLATRVANIEIHGSPQAQEQHIEIAILQDESVRARAYRNRLAGAVAALSGFAAIAAPVIFNHYF